MNASVNAHALLIGINRYPKLPDGHDLRGCLNDLAVMRDILEERFGFPSENIRCLRNEEATRDGIVTAFEELIDRLTPNGRDAVVVYYAGHGSRLRDPVSDDRSLIESMVTYDSGRDPHPNRDLLDRELDSFVRRLSEKSPNVTLIFDCCHSGSVTRNIGGARTRQVRPDLRSAGEMYGPQGPPTPVTDARPLTRSLAEPFGPSGWLPRRNAVLLAACGADELACEHEDDRSGDPVPHGAFTFFVSRELAQARPGTTWRDLFETAAASVQATNRRQHPQMEGPRDRELFGTLARPPRPYLPVTDVTGPTVTLKGGAAHGVTVGSRWRIAKAGSHKPAPEGDELATVEVKSVRATTATADIIEGTGPIEPSQRAFVATSNVPVLGLRVRVDAPSERSDSANTLLEVLDGSPLIRLLPDGSESGCDVLLRLLAPRVSVNETTPCPHLGTLPQWTWVGLGGDGHLAIHLQPDQPAAAQAIRTDLEAVARFGQLLALENPHPTTDLAQHVELALFRGVEEGPLLLAEPEEDGGLLLFEEGDVAEFEIRNHHSTDVYVSLFEFGTDGAVGLLFPSPDCPPFSSESMAIPAGGSIRVGADHFEMPEGLELHLPDNFPWAAEPGEEASGGVICLKLIATLTPADFSSFEQSATRSLGGGHPLQEWVEALGGNGATRSFRPKSRPKPSDDWAVITRTVAVCRPRETHPLPATGGAVLDSSGITLSAPGLAGEVRFERGESARTRDLTGSADVLRNALDERSVRTVATVQVLGAQSETRSVAAVPTTQQGEPAMELGVPDMGPDWRSAVLSVDESGFVRWVFGEQNDDGGYLFLIPRPEVAPNLASTGTRSLFDLPSPRKVMKVIAFKTIEAVGKFAAKGADLWERGFRKYGFRTFTPVDFRTQPIGEEDAAEKALPPGEFGARPLGETDWQKLESGPALAMVHGTFSNTVMAFEQLSEGFVERLHELYDGRVFAFDHPTLSRGLNHNVQWFVDHVPPGVRLSLDIISHSRGGLLGRSLATWAPRLSEGRVSVRRLVCVAAPNRGTALVRAGNLSSLLTTYTHLASQTSASEASRAIRGVIDVAKFLASGMLKSFPGLTVMDPDGSFLPELAASEAERSADELYSISAVAAKSPEAIAAGVHRFTDVLTERVFGEEHDLVVPSAGVYDAPQSPVFPVAKDRSLVVGGVESSAWHNSLFEREDVQRTILRWLSATGRQGNGN